jgi:hypothetical protein
LSAAVVHCDGKPRSSAAAAALSIWVVTGSHFQL